MMRNWIPIVLLDKGLKRDEKGWLTVLFFSAKALPTAFRAFMSFLGLYILFACLPVIKKLHPINCGAGMGILKSLVLVRAALKAIKKCAVVGLRIS